MNHAEVEALIRKHEGVRTKVYADSLGIPTIGVGFNLTRPGAQTRIKAIGSNYDAVLRGDAELTTAQIAGLLTFDIHEATEDARLIVRTFDKHPDSIQAVIVDMVFNLGARGFADFKKTIAALDKGDYSAAADEMALSKWATQVPNRADENIAIIRRYAPRKTA